MMIILLRAAAGGECQVELALEQQQWEKLPLDVKPSHMVGDN